MNGLTAETRQMTSKMFTLLSQMALLYFNESPPNTTVPQKQV